MIRNLGYPLLAFLLSAGVLIGPSAAAGPPKRVVPKRVKPKHVVKHSANKPRVLKHSRGPLLNNTAPRVVPPRRHLPHRKQRVIKKPGWQVLTGQTPRPHPAHGVTVIQRTPQIQVTIVDPGGGKRPRVTTIAPDAIPTEDDPETLPESEPSADSQQEEADALAPVVVRRSGFGPRPAAKTVRPPMRLRTPKRKQVLKRKPVR